MPSTVTIGWPTAEAAITRHEHTSAPSTSTLHEPHSPCSHAPFAPSRPSRSRSTSSRLSPSHESRTAMSLAVDVEHEVLHQAGGCRARSRAPDDRAGSRPPARRPHGAGTPRSNGGRRSGATPPRPASRSGRALGGRPTSSSSRSRRPATLGLRTAHDRRPDRSERQGDAVVDRCRRRGRHWQRRSPWRCAPRPWRSPASRRRTGISISTISSPGSIAVRLTPTMNSRDRHRPHARRRQQRDSGVERGEHREAVARRRTRAEIAGERSGVADLRRPDGARRFGERRHERGDRLGQQLAVGDRRPEW